jgi:hypothetical protein
MMDILMDGGWVSNLGVLIIAVGYLAVGLVFGYTYGYDRGARRERETQRAIARHPMSSAR